MNKNIGCKQLLLCFFFLFFFTERLVAGGSQFIGN